MSINTSLVITGNPSFMESATTFFTARVVHFSPPFLVPFILPSRASSGRHCPSSRTIVTRYVHEEAYCGRCRRSVVQGGEDELLHAPIGPVAKSTAIYLRYRIGMPYRKVQEVFKDLFGLSFVAASALGFDRQAVAKGRRFMKTCGRRSRHRPSSMPMKPPAE